MFDKIIGKLYIYTFFEETPYFRLLLFFVAYLFLFLIHCNKFDQYSIMQLRCSLLNFYPKIVGTCPSEEK